MHECAVCLHFFRYTFCVKCIDRELKDASHVKYVDDDFLHVAMIAANVPR